MSQSLCVSITEKLLQLLTQVNQGSILGQILKLLKQAVCLAQQGLQTSAGDAGGMAQAPMSEDEVPCEAPMSEDEVPCEAPMSEDEVPCEPPPGGDTNTTTQESTPMDTEALLSDGPLDSEQIVPVPQTVATSDTRPMPSTRRRALRSESGSQRTYISTPRGYTTYNEEVWGICLLRHINSQNLKDILRYIVEGSPDKFTSLAAHCVLANKFNLQFALKGQLQDSYSLRKCTTQWVLGLLLTFQRKLCRTGPVQSTCSTCWI